MGIMTLYAIAQGDLVELDTIGRTRHDAWERLCQMTSDAVHSSVSIARLKTSGYRSVKLNISISK